MTNVRQQKVASLLQQALSEVFRQDWQHPAGPALLTISEVRMSPDLSIARIYLSLFKVSDPAAYLDQIKEHQSEIRMLLGRRIRNRVRRIPELQFVLDKTLDHVFHLEELFKQIKKS
ncbi:MAG: 30S ribosome-binding factor RbfA [Chitinophagales bacterium]|nr:30S ribosome-binding factor RbfA [Chitinophagales bacterium]MDW8427142.1 30S ribosome-binding factor RbfA [Chitinophagales bacterium]